MYDYRVTLQCEYGRLDVRVQAASRFGALRQALRFAKSCLSVKWRLVSCTKE